MAGKNYYDILGIKKDAVEKEIKQAYRKKALQFHPDKNQDNKEEAEKKFKDINEAFEVLKDPEKRKIYDTYGVEGLKTGGGRPSGGQSFSFNGSRPGGGGFTFSDPNEIFNQFFGGENPFASGFGGGPGGSSFSFSRPGQNFSFHETPTSSFQSSSGPGFSQSQSSSRFPGAPQGFGAQQQGFPDQQQGQKQQDIVRDLPVSLEDLYNGCQKKLKVTKRIQNPNTNQMTSRETILTVDCKPGWKEGTKVTFPNAGDELVGIPPQNITFVIKEKPHPNFTRDGNDLKTTVRVPLNIALCGGTIECPLLVGTRKLAITPVLQPGTVKTLSGRGMPIKKTDGEKKGDLHVTFMVDLPSQLTKAEQADLARALKNVSYGS